MPEAAPWLFQKITKPMIDLPVEHRVFVGRVITADDDEVLENGFVEIRDGKIVAVGEARDREDLPGDAVVRAAGSILPGLFNSHAHLAWDGVHDLARQSLDDSP